MKYLDFLDCYDPQYLRINYLQSFKVFFFRKNKLYVKWDERFRLVGLMFEDYLQSCL